MIGSNISQRRMCRLLAAQFLYSWSLNPLENLFELDEYVDDFIADYGSEGLDEKSVKFAHELCVGIVENLEVIDGLIEKNTTNWKLDRIAKVDLSILRVSVYEMLFRDDIPPVVSMNEALELGKMLSSDESTRFLNGVLDNIKNVLNRPLRKPASV